MRRGMYFLQGIRVTVLAEMSTDAEHSTPAEESTPSHRVLDFFFTPEDAPSSGGDNPLAQPTTHVPEVIEALCARFKEAILGVEEYAGEQTVLVETRRIADVCRFLKEKQGFTYLADVGGADRFVEEDRFEVFYNLVSFEKEKRIRLKVRVDEAALTAPTVTGVYRAANWNEREVYDMLGIRFEGHPDMRRMFMPEDFEYYPQRKEFPQLGIPGSLPLPPRTPEGPLQYDPFPTAHEGPTPKSYQEPPSQITEEE